MMAHVEEVEVVVAHTERATLRVGDVFLKVDGDPAHADVEVRAMAMAPIPTPAISLKRRSVRQKRVNQLRGYGGVIASCRATSLPSAWSAC